jgi:hypothetical protein
MKQLGFKYSSNMMDYDMPYMLEHKGKPTGFVELPVEWLTDDWPHFEMDRSAPETVYQLWKPEWEAIHEVGLYFGLTCHQNASASSAASKCWRSSSLRRRRAATSGSPRARNSPTGLGRSSSEAI